MQGLMMVEMGVAITLLMKIWVDKHGLTIKEKVSLNILGINSMPVKTIGTTSMSLLLAPTLEVDMANIAVYLGKSYQRLLGVMYFPSTIKHLAQQPLHCLGHIVVVTITWPQTKVGCIMVAQMELKEPTEVVMIGSHIPPPAPEPQLP